MAPPGAEQGLAEFCEPEGNIADRATLRIVSKALQRGKQKESSSKAGFLRLTGTVTFLECACRVDPSTLRDDDFCVIFLAFGQQQYFELADVRNTTISLLIHAFVVLNRYVEFALVLRDRLERTRHVKPHGRPFVRTRKNAVYAYCGVKNPICGRRCRRSVFS